MSGAIRELEKSQTRQLESAKRRGEREIAVLESAHAKNKDEIKKAHSQEIVEIQDQNRRRVDAEAEKKEKILTEMRTHLDETTRLTDKQLKSLKKSSETEKAEIQNALSNDRERISGEHQVYLDDLNGRYSYESKKLNAEGKTRVEDMKQEMAQKYSNDEGFYQSKLNEQTNNFATRFKQDADQYQGLKDNQDYQFKKERLQTNERQQIDMSKLTETHNDSIEKRDTHYRKGLKEQDLFFEDKYKAQVNSHNEHFKKLDEEHKKIVASMKTSLTKDISQAANRHDDPFYEFSALKPKLADYPDRVEIKVEIPEHAKNDLQVTTNGKEAILGLTRRYIDANKTAEGVINKLNKVETFSTRMPTTAMLDPKSVKATFEDGVMTYVIKKT